MTRRERTVWIEALEMRALASGSAQPQPVESTTELNAFTANIAGPTADQTGTPYTVIQTPFGTSLLQDMNGSIEFGRNSALTPFVVAYVDDDRTLQIVGTFADDVVQIRQLSHGRVRVNTNSNALSFPIYRRTKAARHTPGLANGQTFDFNLSSFDRVQVWGGDGGDKIQVNGLPFNPVSDSFESAVVVQHEAPAGRTPSDPIVGGKYGPKSYWATLVKAERDNANASRAENAFFGDSHIKFFPTVGQAAWQSHFRRALSLGIPGDGTRQLLARIKAGLFDHYKPKTLIVSVGANNLNDPTAGGTNAQIAEGIIRVMDTLRARLPQARLVLIGLLPRAAAGLNDRVQAINAEVSEEAGRHGFYYLDVFDHFSGATSALNKKLLVSSSHYTFRGYAVLAALLTDLLKQVDSVGPIRRFDQRA